MDKYKLSLIGAALAAVVLIAGGWFVGVQPQLASASAADAQRTTIEATNASNRDVLRKLEAEFRELGRSKAELAALRKSVPGNADTAGFTRQVNDAATGAGVTMTSLTFGTAQAYAPAGEPTASNGAASAAPSSTASPSSTPAPAATPSAPSTPAAPQPYRNDQITSSTFDLIPVSIAVDAASWAQALDFTKRMQHGDRLFLVDTLSQTAGEGKGPSQSWSLSGYVYVVHAESSASSSSTGAENASSAAVSGTSASATTAPTNG